MSLQDDGRRIFSSFRSRFSSRSKQADDEYDDYATYDEDYVEEYDDYGDGAYDEYGAYDEDGRDVDSAFVPYGPANMRATGDYASSYTPGQPRLVTMEDVRANIPVPAYDDDDMAQIDTARPADEELSSRSFGRTLMDSSLPPEMTPEGTAAMSADATRRYSSGLASLFTPTVDPDADGSADAGAVTASMPRTPAASSGQGAARSYASFGAYGSRRAITVLRPTRYEDAENVVRALDGDGVAVIVLKGVSEPLVTRILDFSFGAAYVLGASAECIGPKVFAISCGAPLSDAERMDLRSQGVL